MYKILLLSCVVFICGCSQSDYEEQVLPLVQQSLQNELTSDYSKKMFLSTSLGGCALAYRLGGKKFSDSDCIKFMKATHPRYNELPNGTPPGVSPEQRALDEFYKRIPDEKNMKDNANTFFKAIQDQKIDQVAEYLPLLEIQGGSTDANTSRHMLAKTQFGEMKFLRAELGEAQMVDNGKEFVAVLPIKLRFEKQGKSYEGISYLFAMAGTNPVKWNFMVGTDFILRMFTSLVPAANTFKINQTLSYDLKSAAWVLAPPMPSPTPVVPSEN